MHCIKTALLAFATLFFLLLNKRNKGLTGFMTLITKKKKKKKKKKGKKKKYSTSFFLAG